MSLATWQLNEFKALGFLILREVFSVAELRRAEAEFERGRTQVLEIGLKPVGVRGQLNWSNLRHENGFLSTLPEDDRIAGVAEQLLGPTAFMVHCNSNQFIGSVTEWHPDSRFTHLRAIKFAWYLSRLGKNNGALRVIPGSHLGSFSTALDELGLAGANVGNDSSYLSTAGKSVRDFPSYVCSIGPRDLIIFDLRLWHASADGHNRRAITSDFHALPESREERKAATTFRELHRASMQTFRTPQPQYDPQWLQNEHSSLRRARWLKALKKMGYLRPLDTGITYK